MILAIQVLIMIFLAFVLILVYLDELRYAKQHKPHAIMEEAWFGEERRRAVRIDGKLDVAYSVGIGKIRDKKAFTENISAGGAKIYVSEKLEKNTPLLFEIKLPGERDPIAAKGKTVWISDAGPEKGSDRRIFAVGINFTHINPKQKKKLYRFIEKEIKTK